VHTHRTSAGTSRPNARAAGQNDGPERSVGGRFRHVRTGCNGGSTRTTITLRAGCVDPLHGAEFQLLPRADCEEAACAATTCHPYAIVAAPAPRRGDAHPRASALTQGPGPVSSRGGGGALAHSGHTSRSLSYAMPCIAQRSIRTSAPLTGWAGSGPVTGGCAGMDRAPSPSIVTPSSVHPHWRTRLRHPVPRDLGVPLGRMGPVTWHPDVCPGGPLPLVRAGDPDVGGTRLARHRLHRRRRWWHGGLDGGRPHVATANDQERHEQQQKGSGNPTTPHVPLHSPRACGRGLAALLCRGVHLVHQDAMSPASKR
jgi:hypothetical protein